MGPEGAEAGEPAQRMKPSGSKLVVRRPPWVEEGSSFPGVLTSLVRTEHFPFHRQHPSSPGLPLTAQCAQWLEPQAGAIFVAHRSHAVNGSPCPLGSGCIMEEAEGQRATDLVPCFAPAPLRGAGGGEGCWAMGWGRALKPSLPQ